MRPDDATRVFDTAADVAAPGAWSGPNPASGDGSRSPGSSSGPAATAPAGTWSSDLAVRLFAPPARWGWRAADPPVPVAPPAGLTPADRPAWAESPSPDTSALRRARSSAVSSLVWRIALAVVVIGVFGTLSALAEQEAQELGGEQSQSATEVLGIVALVGGGVLTVSVIRAALGVAAANRAIARFERPYKALRSAERQRHQEALAEWEGAVRQHQAAVAQAQHQQAVGPRWFPVHPASDPTRVDVVGGDPRGHGWASLLVTLGTSVLAGGQQLTVLDLTGKDVGGGLVRVAQAQGLTTRRIDLPDDGADVNLLDGLRAPELAECLADALTARPEPGDRRHERAFAQDLLDRVVTSLDGEVSLGRLAAGVDVLRQMTPAGTLATGEVSRLADQVGEVGQDEWSTRQMRFVSSQLRGLAAVAPDGATGGAGGTTSPRPALWAPAPVSLVTTAGGPDDRKELLDRLLVELAQRALRRGRRIDGVLAVAGADHLGASSLEVLSDHARTAGVRLVLLIGQPQGDLEKTLGTGGAVCIMKMYNHRDANVAAELVGRGHKFVLNQLTFQVGKTFSDGGGDSFSANTSQGTSTRKRPSGLRRTDRDLSDSRGHAWTGARNWSIADNISDSRSSARVYEFIVEPQEVLGMPETAFLLVDNTGQGRRVVMADSNPGICLLDGIAAGPT